MTNKYLEKIAGPASNFIRSAVSKMPGDIAGPISSKLAAKPFGVKRGLLQAVRGDHTDIGIVANTALRK